MGIIVLFFHTLRENVICFLYHQKSVKYSPRKSVYIRTLEPFAVPGEFAWRQPSTQAETGTGTGSITIDAPGVPGAEVEAAPVTVGYG